MPSNRVRLYQHFVFMSKHGSTDEEAEDALGLPHQTVSAVRGELVKMGAVVSTEVCRWTRSKKKATVRVAVPNVDVTQRLGMTAAEEKQRWIRAQIRNVDEAVLDDIIDMLRIALTPPGQTKQLTIMDLFGEASP
jgi:hypothetical protein